MLYFILISLHCGFIAIIVGTALNARINWVRRNWIISVIGGLHSAAWSLAWVGLTIETFGGTL